MPDMISRFINYLDVGIIPDMVSRFIASDVNEIAFNDAIQKQKLNYRCKEGTVEAGSFKCGNTPEEAKKNYEEQQKEKLPSSKSGILQEKPTTENKLSAKEKDVAETHPGLTKLQSDIKKSGGADKFFDKLKIPDGSDTSLRSVSVKELNSDYPPKFKSAPFATYGNITLHYGKENPKDIIAVAGGKVVGYAMDDSNEEEGLFSVAAVVANEFRGQNLGSKLLYNFYDKNPDKIGKAGSLTPDGKKAFKRVLKGIEDGSFKKVLEVDTKQLPAKQEKTATKSKLSAKEKDTISEYTGFKYAPINQYLFGKQLNLTAKQDAGIKQNINNLTNIINNNKINTSMKVYRGLTGQSKEEFLNMVKNVKPGNSFEYAGFMSTSPDKSIGERFATWGNKGKTVLLEIDLPKDSNAMDISKHTASKKYGETEILVAPGFELVLNKVEKNKGADIYHLTYKQSKKRNK